MWERLDQIRDLDNSINKTRVPRGRGKVQLFLGEKLFFFLITIVLNRGKLQNQNTAVVLRKVQIQVTNTVTSHNNIQAIFYQKAFLNVLIIYPSTNSNVSFAFPL